MEATLSVLGDIVLLRPWWLLALPAILALHLVAGRRGDGLGAWARAVDPWLLPALARLGHVVPGAGRAGWAFTATAAVVAVALSGPAVRARDDDALRNLDGVVLVVDLSESVARGGALGPVKAAARRLLAAAGTRPVALIVYAGDAYAAVPLTNDPQIAARIIAALDEETVPDPGSRPERGLDLAAGMVEDAGILAGDVVILGDGGGIGDAALGAAERVRDLGGRVSSVFTLSHQGRRAVGPAGWARMQSLAGRGGGVAVDLSEFDGLTRLISRGTGARLADSGYAALVWNDYGRALIALALLPALLMFRRRS